MNLILRIHFRVQKITLNTKGNTRAYLGSNATFWTLSSITNNLELILCSFNSFSYFSQLFLFFFSFFLPCLIQDFGTPIYQESFPHTCFLQCNDQKEFILSYAFTMLQEQRYGWSYSRLGEDNCGLTKKVGYTRLNGVKSYKTNEIGKYGNLAMVVTTQLHLEYVLCNSITCFE